MALRRNDPVSDEVRASGHRSPSANRDRQPPRRVAAAPRRAAAVDAARLHELRPPVRRTGVAAEAVAGV